MRVVLHTKYAIAAPTSGLATSHENIVPGDGPPSDEYTIPVVFTVKTSAAMLNNVRCAGDLIWVRKVHWLQALTAATIIVASAPSSSSAAKSTAYDTDIVEPLVVRGRLTFIAEASDEKRSRTTNSATLGRVRSALKPNSARRVAPAARVAATYRRAANGSSFIDGPEGPHPHATTGHRCRELMIS